MNRVCLICYKLNFAIVSSSCANSPVAQAKGKLLQFLKLVDNGTFRLPLEDVINAGIHGCDECSNHLKDIYELYNQKAKTENLLSKQVSDLETNMSRAQADSFKLQNFRTGANRLNLTDNTVDEIINFRNKIIQNSKRVLGAPLLPLPTLTPHTHHNHETEMEAVKNLNVITTGCFKNRAGSSTSSTPANTNALDPTTKSKSRSYSPLYIISNEHESTHEISDAAVTTAVNSALNQNVTRLKYLFEPDLAGNLNQNLAKEIKSLNDSDIKLNNPPAEAGTIPIPGNSRREGENVDRMDPPGKSGASNHKRLFGKTVRRTLSDTRKSLSPDTLKSGTALRKGKTTSKPPETKFICDFCALSFPNYTELLWHFKSCKNMKTKSSSAVSINPYLSTPQTASSNSELQFQHQAVDRMDPLDTPTARTQKKVYRKTKTVRRMLSDHRKAISTNTFKSKTALGKDKTTLDPPEQQYKCDSCAASFRSSNTFLRHLKSCKNTKKDSTSRVLSNPHLSTPPSNSEPQLQVPLQADTTGEASNLRIDELPNYNVPTRGFYKFVNGLMVFQPEKNEYGITGRVGNPDAVTLKNKESSTSSDSE